MALPSPGSGARRRSGDQLYGKGAGFRDDPARPAKTAVYGCRWSAAGQELAGPCLIQLPGCVVVVPPGGRAASDDLGVIHVQVGRAS